MIRCDKVACLAARGEDSLQGDDERKAEIRHHVVVGQIAAGNGRGKRAHGHIVAGGCIHGRRTAASAGPDRILRAVGTAASGNAPGCMGMGLYFGQQQRYALLTAGLTQLAQAEARSLALLQWRGALEIRQGKVALSIAAIGGAQQREKRRVLADGQELAITEGPARGGKVSCKYSYFSYKWI